MAFGDQINRQTSPRPNSHECSCYLDQYRWHFLTGSLGYNISGMGVESSIILMGEKMIYPHYGTSVISIPLGVYRNHSFHNINISQSNFEAGITAVFFKLNIKVDGSKL